MATKAGEAFIAVQADLSKFNKEIDTGTKTAGSKIGGFAKTAGIAIGGAFVASKAKDFFGAAITGARESAQLMAQTENVIKSTGGAAGITADEIGKMSSALSMETGIHDEVIQSGANLLLTFKEITNAAGDGNDVFDQTVALANDMSIAMGQDMKSSSIQLGKALNDPIKGVSALSRVGVGFTEQQKEQIKTLQESGDVLGAQKIILAEVESQFGGSAAAQATSADKLAVSWDNFQQTIGDLLLPVVEKVMGWLAKLAQWATDHPKSFALIAGIIGGAVVAAFVAWAVSAATAMAANIAAVAVLVAGWITGAAASLAGAASVALAWIIAFGPIALIIAAFVGLVVAVVKNWDTIKAAFKAAADWIYDKVEALVGFFTGLPRRIADAVKGMWDGVKDSFKAAINWIIDKWNNFGLTLGGQEVKFAGLSVTIPEFRLDTPDIPRLHEGGTYRAPTPGGEGLALLRDGERVTPAGQGGGVEINVSGANDPGAVAEQVARTLEWRRLSMAGR